MLRRRLGSVPTRWLSNYVHVVLEERGFSRDGGRLKFAAPMALLMWWASLRWSRRVSTQGRAVTWDWIPGATRARRNRSMPAPADSRSRAAGRRRLRVGLDVSLTGTCKAGCGHLTLGLVQALQDLGTANDYLLYPTFGDAFWDPAWAEATWRGHRSNVQAWPGQASPLEARAFWRSPRSNLDGALGNPDIVHSHNFFCPRDLERARLVYTLYDLSFLAHPEWTTEANRQATFTGVFNASLHADLIIAISEATRRHFLKVFPHYPEHRTAVIHPASRFASRTPAPRTRECRRLTAARFFLSVGTLEPRKNLMRLVQAYAGYAAQSRDPMPLVMAGGRGWLMEGFDQQIRELDLSQRVIRLGYVDDRTLLWLYQNCHSFLYPSLFEGFGLPVLEALSQGAAVVTSRATALPEVAGEAALYVAAGDISDIAQGLIRIAGDEELRADLRRKAPEQAARFSWRSAAEQTVACYERVLKMERYGAHSAKALSART